MPNSDYQKTLRVQAAPEMLYDAITSVDGLAAWWTPTSGSTSCGGELRFWFDAPDVCVMRVDESERASSVRWTVTACDFLPDWVDTRPAFTITPIDEQFTELTFRHHGLTADLECIDMCTRGWNHYLASLRQYAETGQGMPRGSTADTARRQP